MNFPGEPSGFCSFVLYIEYFLITSFVTLSFQFFMLALLDIDDGSSIMDQVVLWLLCVEEASRFLHCREPLLKMVTK